MMTRIKRSKATNAYELFNDVAQAMQDEPRRVDMGTWLRRILTKTFKPQSGIDVVDGIRTNKRRTYISAPSCGTVGCVAGWVCALTRSTRGRFDDVTSMKYDAQNLLADRWNTDMHNDLENLFHGNALTTDWRLPKEQRRVPYPFPMHRVGTKAYANAVVANIRKFQAKWEAELKAKAI